MPTDAVRDAIIVMVAASAILAAAAVFTDADLAVYRLMEKRAMRLAVFALIAIALALGACQSWPNPPPTKWQMYRFDKNYNPHRVK